MRNYTYHPYQTHCTSEVYQAEVRLGETLCYLPILALLTVPTLLAVLATQVQLGELREAKLQQGSALTATQARVHIRPHSYSPRNGGSITCAGRAFLLVPDAPKNTGNEQPPRWFTQWHLHADKNPDTLPCEAAWGGGGLRASCDYFPFLLVGRPRREHFTWRSHD